MELAGDASLIILHLLLEFIALLFTPQSFGIDVIY